MALILLTEAVAQKTTDLKLQEKIRDNYRHYAPNNNKYWERRGKNSWVNSDEFDAWLAESKYFKPQPDNGIHCTFDLGGLGICGYGGFSDKELLDKLVRQDIQQQQEIERLKAEIKELKIKADEWDSLCAKNKKSAAKKPRTEKI